MGRGFLISLLRMLRDYSIVTCLIKYTLGALLRPSGHKEVRTTCQWLAPSDRDDHGYLDVVCVTALIARLRRLSFAAGIKVSTTGATSFAITFPCFPWGLKVFCIAHLRTLYWIAPGDQGPRGEAIVRPSAGMRISAGYSWGFKLGTEVAPCSARRLTDSVRCLQTPSGVRARARI